MYESDTSAVTDALHAANPVVFSDNTISQILALTTKQGDTAVRFDTATPDANGNVTVAAGAEVVYVASSDTQQTTIKPPVNAPVVIFQGKGGVVATFNDQVTVPSGSGAVDRVVVGSSGNDKIIVSDARNTQVILGSGDSSVQTGSGVDTVEAGIGNSTITGGSGDYSVVKLSGSAGGFNTAIKNTTVASDSTTNSVVITNTTTGKTTEISKIQFVQLDNNQAMVFAKDSTEAAVASLYRATFGRDADAAGLDYWLDLVKDGADYATLAKAFVNSAEFNDGAGKLSDTDFLSGLYQNIFSRAADDAGLKYWGDALAAGTNRADVIAAFSYIAGQNIAGTSDSEVTITGSVHVVSGII